jgi:Type IV secretion-system coupling protein DNA-binding domain
MRRNKGVYIIGLPGTGKSTLMLSMIRQDILNGKGICVIDPHGDLAEKVLRCVPQERIEDAIYFDPLVTPIGLNLFKTTSEEEKQIIASDLFLVFKRLTGTADLVQADAILKRAIQLLLEVPGSTFHDLYRLMTDDYFRHSLIERVQVPSIRDFWTNVWKTYKHPETERPITTRMSEFDSNLWLQKVLSTLSSFSVYDIIRRKKIFIANISKGALGRDASASLGTLLVSQYQLAGFRQALLPESQRIPCYMYIDEFQNFKTSAFNEIIIESRKFLLCLTLANQKLKDLDDETKSGIEAIGTYIFFRLTTTDAHKYAKEVGKYTADDLMNLDDFHAIIRPGKPILSKKFETEEPAPLPKGFRNEIIEHTRRSYPAIIPLKHEPTPILDPDAEPLPTPFPQD